MNLRRKDRILLPTEICEAETFWIKQAQAQAFPSGENEGSLTQLNPKSDGDGLLRMDGRLRFADELPYDTRHPILLPKDHPVTRLVIADAHERLGHGAGVEQVLTELRSRFWIVKGRRMARNVTEACAECRRRFTMKIGHQMMASLPKTRLQSSLGAFEKVGVDYGGPFLTKQGRGRTRAKRYLCLFTCLTTRAVHLEMAYSKKWFHPRHNLKEGDVVLIVEPNASRGEWPLGRVIEAYPVDDGLVRVVKVKAKNKEYLRPVHRLCPLEYVEDSAEE